MRRLPPLYLLCVFLLACNPAPPKPEAPPALVGAWRSSLQFTSGAFASIKDLEFMYLFNSGGTLTESSNYDGAPPVPPAYGVWRAVSPREYEAKYEFYITAPAPAEAFKTGAGWLPAGRGVDATTVPMTTPSPRPLPTRHSTIRASPPRAAARRLDGVRESPSDMQPTPASRGMNPRATRDTVPGAFHAVQEQGTTGNSPSCW